MGLEKHGNMSKHVEIQAIDGDFKKQTECDAREHGDIHMQALETLETSSTSFSGFQGIRVTRSVHEAHGRLFFQT